jgi:hypothetical protein
MAVCVAMNGCFDCHEEMYDAIILVDRIRKSLPYIGTPTTTHDKLELQESAASCVIRSSSVSFYTHEAFIKYPS